MCVQGEIGSFDWQTLLTTLVTGLLVLGAANSATDMLMVYVLKGRKYYAARAYPAAAHSLQPYSVPP
jgi:hypothetical protein